MTRCNLIPVEELSDQHLLAEHREIKRIPNVIVSGKYSLTNIPDNYTMGEGHVKFFYNKLAWLIVRYAQLHGECFKRGFEVDNYLSAWDNVPDELFKPWRPTEYDIRVSRTRIAEKIFQKDICQQKGFYRWSK